MGAVSQHDESRTATHAERLSTHPLARHLNLWIIGTRITPDRVALVIDRFARSCDPFEISAQFCVAYPCVDLSHFQGPMPQEATDYFKGDIFVNEVHGKRVPKLMSRKPIELLIAISDTM